IIRQDPIHYLAIAEDHARPEALQFGPREKNTRRFGVGVEVFDERDGFYLAVRNHREGSVWFQQFQPLRLQITERIYVADQVFAIEPANDYLFCSGCGHGALSDCASFRKTRPRLENGREFDREMSGHPDSEHSGRKESPRIVRIDSNIFADIVSLLERDGPYGHREHHCRDAVGKRHTRFSRVLPYGKGPFEEFSGGLRPGSWPFSRFRGTPDGRRIP